MIFEKSLSSKLFKVFFVFLVITIILQPWRGSLSQDDATYAYQAIEISMGNWNVPPVNLAPMWLQPVLGALVIKLFSSMDPLKILNGLTWACFGLLMLLMAKKTHFRWELLLSLFLFPIWVQYGASFLYEIYLSLILLGYIFFFKLGHSYRYIFIIFLSLQNVSFLAVPFFLEIFDHKNLKQKILPLSIITLSLVSYVFMPKSLFAEQFSIYLIENVKNSNALKILIHSGQHFLAFGIYFIPLLKIKNLLSLKFLKPLFVFVTVVGFFIFSDYRPLSAGVFFSDYLPKSIAASLLASGVFGLYAIFNLLKAEKNNGLVYALYSSVFLLSLFNGVRDAVDIRYMMPLVIPFLFVMGSFVREKKRKRFKDNFIGASKAYLILIIFVTVFTNLYNLNTTEARWKVASDIADKYGTEDFEISAGYGRNLFYLGNKCAQNALEKLEAQGAELHFSDPLFREHYFNKIPEIYKNQWVAKYLIKPSQFMGKELNLKHKRESGQDKEPIMARKYNVLGLQNEVSVVYNKNYKAPWCLK